MRDVGHRSQLYTFLAHCFSAEPRRELLAPLGAPGMSELLEAAGATTTATLARRGHSGITMDELEAEYARLYVGPGTHIPPYESAFGSKSSPYTHGFQEMHGESYGDVLRSYAEFGYQPTAMFKDIEDHLGVELDFMRYLTFRENVMWGRGDGAAAEELRRQQTRFIDEHLLTWVPRFAGLTAQVAALSFYPEMSELTNAFLASEHLHLAQHSL